MGSWVEVVAKGKRLTSPSSSACVLDWTIIMSCLGHWKKTAQFFADLLFCCVSELKWHMEGSDGQQLWHEVGGEEYAIKKREHGLKQDTQLSVQFTMSSSN